MNDTQNKIFNLKVKERELVISIRKIKTEIEKLQEEVDYAEQTLNDKITTAEEEFLESENERVKAEYQPKFDALEAKLAELEKELGIEEVEETEELILARETKEYLNTAAVIINRYYEELKKVSSSYFIDLAYNEKFMNIKTFKKTFKTIPERIEVLIGMRTTITQPFKYIESKSQTSGVNASVYLTSSLLSFWVAVTTPIAVSKAVKRSHYLHSSAYLYHRLMHTLVSLQDKTDQEIAEIFGALLKLKGQRIQTLIKNTQVELDTLTQELEDELGDISFDSDSMRRRENMELGAKRTKLESLKANCETQEFELKEVEESLLELLGERKSELELERELFLKSRDEREVVIPDRLLYDWNKDSNIKFEIKNGLYLYTDRADVADFVQLVIFQLRNVMEWGAVQFKVLDLLGAEFVAPMMLPMTGKAKVQDILIFTLRDEREQSIELLHDMLTRRKTQVLQTVSSLGDYNLLQKASGSAPMPYQFTFIVLDDALKMDEKLIQLIHNGAKVGIMVFIFMKEELLTVQLSKSIETYFENFIELSSSGLSSYEPEQYTEILERKESDRKSRI